MNIITPTPMAGPIITINNLAGIIKHAAMKNPKQKCPITKSIIAFIIYP